MRSPYFSSFDHFSPSDRTVGDKGRIPIPSHYFVVMLRCPADNPSNCADMSYETQAFVVEHRANVTNCMVIIKSPM